MPVDKCQWCEKPATNIVYRKSDGQPTPCCKDCKATAIGYGKYQYHRKLKTKPTGL